MFYFLTHTCQWALQNKEIEQFNVSEISGIETLTFTFGDVTYQIDVPLDILEDIDNGKTQSNRLTVLKCKSPWKLRRNSKSYICPEICFLSYSRYNT